MVLCQEKVMKKYVAHLTTMLVCLLWAALPAVALGVDSLALPVAYLLGRYAAKWLQGELEKRIK